MPVDLLPHPMVRTHFWVPERLRSFVSYSAGQEAPFRRNNFLQLEKALLAAGGLMAA